MQNIEIDLIKIDGGTQRRQLDKEVSDHYAALMKEAVEFPAIELIHTGRHFYVWDGFHRLSAAKMIESKTIKANVRNGTLEDAIWLSYSANTKHGLARKPGEVKKAIAEILSNPKWSCKTDKEIAEHINTTVGNIQKERSIKKSNNLTMVSISDTTALKSDKDEMVADTPPVEVEDIKSVCDDVEKIPNERPAEVLMDKENNIIPEQLQERWLENQKLSKYINILNSVKRDIDSMIAEENPVIRLLHRQAFESDLKNTKRDIMNSLFYAVCPLCEPNKKCDVCKETNFVTKAIFGRIPKDEF